MKATEAPSYEGLRNDGPAFREGCILARILGVYSPNKIYSQQEVSITLSSGIELFRAEFEKERQGISYSILEFLLRGMELNSKKQNLEAIPDDFRRAIEEMFKKRLDFIRTEGRRYW